MMHPAAAQEEAGRIRVVTVEAPSSSWRS